MPKNTNRDVSSAPVCSFQQPEQEKTHARNESLVSASQPFASQIVIGEKTIEWRSKPFNWRGPLVICASKSAIIELDNGKRLPVGVALGIVDVVGCRPMTRKDLVAACCEDYEDEM